MDDAVKFAEIANKYSELQSRIQQQFRSITDTRALIDSLSVSEISLDNYDQLQSSFQNTNSVIANNAIAPICVVPNPFATTITESIDGASGTKRFCDVIFVINDGVNTADIYGVSALFAMHSPVFAEMLYRNSDSVRSHQPMTVRIEDANVSTSTFRTLSYILYGLKHPQNILDQQNAINLLYAANKYKIHSLRVFCMDFIVKNIVQNKEDIQCICSVLNGMIDRTLLSDFDEIVSRTIITENINIDKVNLLQKLSMNAFQRLIFDSPFRSNLTEEQKWNLCLKYSKCQGSQWRETMKQFTGKIDFQSMSGPFFLSKVQPLNVLNNQQLIQIMQGFLGNDQNKSTSKKSENEDTLEINEYNREYASVVVHGDTTTIITNGKGGCQWIWFGSHNGWKSSKHVWTVKCRGVPHHRSGNIISLIGTTDYKLIQHVWKESECVFDLDLNERDSDDDDCNDEKEGSEGNESEVVSISYDWNGYLYKNDTMLESTGHPWSENDEITVTIDLEKKDIRLCKNGVSITELEIVPADDLMWYPVLQTCGCKGHHYTCCAS